MKSQRKIAALWAGIVLSGVTAGYAVPTLQLDIPGGTYNTTDQTTYANTPQFTVNALLNGKLDTSATYYISAAIEPKLGLSTPPPNIGSFTLNGNTYTTANMNWGDPPANVIDGKNLPTHDEFPTYYAEFAFHFTSATVPSYDTQTGDTANGNLYIYSLLADISGLLPGYSVHFDLYDEAVEKKTGNYTLDDFAPFSHDAQSGTNTTTTTTQVPDNGSTYLLLGLGLAGLVVAGRSRLYRA